MKSSVTRSKLSLRSGAFCVSLVYNGIFGIVGERACAPVMPNALSASALLRCWVWMLMEARSCLGAVEIVGGLFLVTTKARGIFGVFAVRGVLPCGLLEA